MLGKGWGKKAAICIALGVPALGFASAALAGRGGEPSFPCQSAATRIEHALCANPELGSLDHRLADAYRGAQSVSRWSDWQQEEQADWQKQRDLCSDASPGGFERCLRTIYEVRLDEVVFMAEPGAAETPAGRLAGTWHLTGAEGPHRVMVMTIHPVAPEALRVFVAGIQDNSPRHICAFSSDASMTGEGGLRLGEPDADDPVTAKIKDDRLELVGGAASYCSWNTSFSGIYVRDTRI